MKACDPLKLFKRQPIIIRHAIKIIMVMSFEYFEDFEGSFYTPL